MISFFVNCSASSRNSSCSDVGVKLYPISERGSSEIVWGWAPAVEALEEMPLAPDPERR